MIEIKYKPKLYYETIDILVKAYEEGTLMHHHCAACAVGNIIAARNKFKIVSIPLFGTASILWKTKEHRGILPAWTFRVFEERVPCKSRQIPSDRTSQSDNEVQSSGYTALELSKIEAAFESTDNGQDLVDSDGYLGLLAVVDVLQEIHQVTSTLTNISKEKFTNIKNQKKCNLTHA